MDHRNKLVERTTEIWRADRVAVAVAVAGETLRLCLSGRPASRLTLDMDMDGQGHGHPPQVVVRNETHAQCPTFMI